MKRLSWLMKKSAFRTTMLLATGALLLTVIFELAVFATWWPLRDLINLAEQGKEITVYNFSFLLVTGIFVSITVLYLALEYAKHFLQMKVQISMRNIATETQALQSLVPNSNLSRAEQIVQQGQMQKTGSAIVSAIFGLGPTFIRLSSLTTAFFIFSYEMGVLPLGAVLSTILLVFSLLPILSRMKEAREADDAVVETAAVKRIEEYPIKYILGLEYEDAGQVREAGQQLYGAEKVRHAKWNSVFFFITLVPTIAKVIMIFMLLGMRTTSSISTGGLMVLLAWTFMFDQFARDLQNLTYIILGGKASWDSFKSYFYDAQDAKDKVWEWPEKNTGTVSFEDVSVTFGEEGEERKEILRNIFLDIPFGTCLVLYSPSGGGKSTLLRLLQGACEFDGKLLIDGVDIRNIDSVRYRKEYLSVVLQDLQLFRGTVFSNVAISNPAAQVEDVEKALHQVGFNVAGGEQLSLDFVVKQFGENLSGGQKQRLALARAFLRDSSKIMLIDEPTSALDDANAERVINLFTETARTREKTVIIATHDPRFKQIPGFRVVELINGEISLSMAA